MKTIEELRKLDTAKLLQELEESTKEGFKTTFAVKNGQANNTDKIRKYKKYIARIKTIIKENLEKEA